MNKITIVRDGYTITIETDEATVSDLIEGFEDALKGLGYNFTGQIDIVDQEED
jgi:hypothetical protein